MKVETALVSKVICELSASSNGYLHRHTLAVVLACELQTLHPRFDARAFVQACEPLACRDCCTHERLAECQSHNILCVGEAMRVGGSAKLDIDADDVI